MTEASTAWPAAAVKPPGAVLPLRKGAGEFNDGWGGWNEDDRGEALEWASRRAICRLISKSRLRGHAGDFCYLDISSSDRFFTFGPNNPMASATTPIAPAISVNTPATPALRSTKAMTKALNTVDSRLKE